MLMFVDVQDLKQSPVIDQKNKPSSIVVLYLSNCRAGHGQMRRELNGALTVWNTSTSSAERRA